MLTKLRQLLFVCRVLDESGTLSITHGFIVLAGVVYYLHPDATTAATVAAAVANYAYAKKWLPHVRAQGEAAADQKAAELSHAERMAAISADSQTLHAAVKALGEQVSKLATPERMEAIKRMTGQDVRPAPRLGPVSPLR